MIFVIWVMGCDFAARPLWIPAYAGMTGFRRNDGVDIPCVRFAPRPLSLHEKGVDSSNLCLIRVLVKCAGNPHPNALSNRL